MYMQYYIQVPLRTLGASAGRSSQLIRGPSNDPTIEGDTIHNWYGMHPSSSASHWTNERRTNQTAMEIIHTPDAGSLIGILSEPEVRVVVASVARR